MTHQPHHPPHSPITKALSFFMAAIMVVSLVPAPALAATKATMEIEGRNDDGTPTHINSITMSPYTYVDKSKLINPEGGAAELNESNLRTIADGLFADWGPIAYKAFETNTDCTHHNNSSSFVENFGPNAEEKEENLRLEEYLSGRKTPDKFVRGEQSDDIVVASGLSYATSLNAVVKNAATELSEAIGKGNTTADETYQEAKLDNIKKMTDTSKVYYRTLVSVNRRTASNEFRYNVYTLAFYDFSLSPLVADGITAANPHVVESTSDEAENKSTSYFENRSQSESEITAEQSSETVESVSNSIENTQSFGFEESIGTEIELKGFLGVVENAIKFQASFTASQSIETAYGQETSVEKHYSSGTSSSVTLPPHTAIGVEQSAGKSSTTLSYDCPTALNYKVAIFSFSGYRYDDGWSAIHEWDSNKCFSCLFGTGETSGGATAPANLYLRALDPATAGSMEQAYGQTIGYEEDTLRSSGLNWDKFAGVLPHAQNIIKNVPMVASGATMTMTTEGKSTALGEIVPLYRLTEVKLTGGEDQYDLVVGDSMSLSALEVTGYDYQDIEYYGFDGDKGHWVLADEDGNELNSSDVITLKTNARTGRQTITATGAGEAYLMWVLDDGITYKGKNDPTVVSSTENVPIYPLVQIVTTVSAPGPTGYKVEATGDATVTVNESLNLPQNYPGAVYDARDRVISHAVTYEAQDTTAPVRIDADGNFVATKQGDYKVRAVYAYQDETFVSPWFVVHVVPDPAVESATAQPAELTAEGGSAGVVLGGKYLHNDLTVVLTDPEGNEMSALTAGSSAEQTASFVLPPVTDFNTQREYKVSYEVAGVRTNTDVVITVKGNTLRAVEEVPATCTEEGTIAYWECVETGKPYADENGLVPLEAEDLVAPKLAHKLTKTDAVSATCTEEGREAYWTCDDCKKVFSDDQGTTEVELDDLVIAPLDHDWGDWTVTTPATETEEGEEQRVCKHDATHVDTRTIDVLPHTHKLVKTEAQAATCTEAGNIEYWTCSGCSEIFADDKATNAILAEDTVVPALDHDWNDWTVTTPATETEEGEEQRVCKHDATHVQTRTTPMLEHVHVLERVEHVAATCTEAGNMEYWACSSCGRLFSDALGTMEINAENTVIKPTGHEWDEGTVTTDPGCITKGVRTFTCLNDSTHTRTESVAPTGHIWDEGAITTAPGCTTKGVMTYTCLNDPTHTKTADVTPIGHAWDEGTVTTAPGCTTAGEKTIVCLNDPTHTKTEVVPSIGHAWDKGAVTTAPTCTTTGVKTFTCLNDGAHTRTESVAAIGHAWDRPVYTWSEDGTKMTATRMCKNDPAHVETEVATAKYNVTAKPTCTKAGKATYTVTFKNAAFKTQRRTESIAALGHDWDKTTYKWSDGNKTLVAKHVCKNDASHVKKAKAKVRDRVTKQPTELDDGTRTFVGTFNVPWATTQTKTVTVPALGMPGIFATARVHGKGWLEYEPDRAFAGTTGKSLALDAFALKLTNASVSGGIQYRCSIQGYGWQKGWKHDGIRSGSTGGKLRPIEAVQIKLYGKMAEKYDLYYRVHSQKYGWLGWVKNGQRAGTQNMALRGEGIQMVLVLKGSKAPAKTYNGIKQTYAKAFIAQ
ncbi:MAG: hypothetical protein J6S63_02710 [Atopobiaceae bacterium]|nr:hypothetical protein [Atopobiaceae bacterium]